MESNEDTKEINVWDITVCMFTGKCKPYTARKSENKLLKYSTRRVN